MIKSKEYQAIEKARLQYDTETCVHTKSRLKKFILTQSQLLENKGIDCTSLYFDLIEGVTASPNSKQKRMMIDQSEFDRLVKADNDLVVLQRKVNNLIVENNALKTKIASGSNTDYLDEIDALKNKVQNQKMQLAQLLTEKRTSSTPKKQTVIENLSSADVKKFEMAKQTRDEYAAELDVYKKTFTAFKEFAVNRDIPEILLIIQKGYIEIDNVRGKVRKSI